MVEGFKGAICRKWHGDSIRPKRLLIVAHCGKLVSSLSRACSGLKCKLRACAASAVALVWLAC